MTTEKQAVFVNYIRDLRGKIPDDIYVELNLKYSEALHERYENMIEPKYNRESWSEESFYRLVFFRHYLNEVVERAGGIIVTRPTEDDFSVGRLMICLPGGFECETDVVIGGETITDYIYLLSDTLKSLISKNNP